MHYLHSIITCSASHQSRTLFRKFSLTSRSKCRLFLAAIATVTSLIRLFLDGFQSFSKAWPALHTNKTWWRCFWALQSDETWWPWHASPFSSISMQKYLLSFSMLLYWGKTRACTHLIIGPESIHYLDASYILHKFIKFILLCMSLLLSGRESILKYFINSWFPLRIICAEMHLCRYVFYTAICQILYIQVEI